MKRTKHRKKYRKNIFKVPPAIWILFGMRDKLQFNVYFFFENMYVEEMGDRPSNWLKLLLSLLLSWKDNLT